MLTSRITAAALLLIGLATTGMADSITLRSGNGDTSEDSDVTMLVGPANGPFASAFTSSDFASARNGTKAQIISPNAAWNDTLASNMEAQWISTIASGASEGSTALYAIDFTVNAASIASATLDFSFMVDNDLGDTDANGDFVIGGNEGLFINGIALDESTLGTTQFEFFEEEQSFGEFDISSLLVSGVNTLYINAVDRGGPSGLIFSAEINYEEATVPEPASLAMFGMGVVGVTLLRRRSRA